MQAEKIRLRKKHSGCVLRLASNEYKRVPTDSSYPAVGYYIRCHHCGVITVILASENGASDPSDVLSVDAFECTTCRRKQVIRDGVIFDA